MRTRQKTARACARNAGGSLTKSACAWQARRCGTERLRISGFLVIWISFVAAGCRHQRNVLFWRFMFSRDIVDIFALNVAVNRGAIGVNMRLSRWGDLSINIVRAFRQRRWRAFFASRVSGSAAVSQHTGHGKAGERRVDVYISDA
jgi:hypothetical protein